MNQTPLNTSFPYIYKHPDFPHYQGQLRTLSAKLELCSFKTVGVQGFEGRGEGGGGRGRGKGGGGRGRGEISHKFPCRL